MTDDDVQVQTLGQRLDRLGRRVADRHRPAFGQVEAMGPALARAIRLNQAHRGRFDREEVPGAASADPAGRRAHLTEQPGAVVRPGRPRSAAAPGAPAGAPAEAAGGPRPPAGAAGGRRLPADVRTLVGAVAGPGAEALRVHDDAAADVLAREHGADAVTVGSGVYFRDGRYAPQDAGGLALLAHEASHVTARLDSPAPPLGAGAAGREEVRARAVERVVAERAGPAFGPGRDSADPAGAMAAAASALRTSPPPSLAPAPPSTPPGPASPSTGPAAAVVAHRAATDRELPQPAAAPDLVTVREALRQDLMNDLMRQLRAEFERGG